MLPQIRSFVRSLFQRRQIEKDMSDELQFHIEQRAADLASRRGLTNQEALREARLEFGSIEKHKEEGRQARGLRLIDEIRADLRYASRMLWKSPVLTAAAVATLGIGIGANTSVFTLTNEVLLKPLPVKDPEGLVAFTWLGGRDVMLAGYDGAGFPDPKTGETVRTSFPYGTYDRIRTENHTMTDVFAFADAGGVSLAVDREAEMTSGHFVSGGYFGGLGVRAAAGRIILPIDDMPGAQPVVVLSHEYWLRRFQGVDVVGKTAILNGAAHAIIGVAQPGFAGTRIGESVDVFIPMPREANPGWMWWVQIMGRTRPETSQPGIVADVQGAFARTVVESWESRPASRRTETLNKRTAMPQLRIADGRRGPQRPDASVSAVMPILIAIVGVVLIIICGNLAALLLARADARRSEIAVRLAIGARRGRVIRQLITESLVLACVGGGVGVLLAYWGKGLLSWFPPTSEVKLEPSIDWTALAFTAGISLVAAVAVGILPALRATRRDRLLTHVARRGGSSRYAFSKTLLIGQVALCMVLLVGAALFIRSVQNLDHAEMGFNPENLVIFGVDASLNKYGPAEGRQLYERMVENVQAVPGVQAVTMSGHRLISGGGRSAPIVRDEAGVSAPTNETYILDVRENYFATMGMPILRGRSWMANETSGSLRPVIINQTMARNLFGEVDPIGKRLKFFEAPDLKPLEVVGITADAKYTEVKEVPPPTMYLPFSERPFSPTFEVRTAVDPLSVMPAIREAVRRVDSNLPIFEMTTQAEQIDASISALRMFRIVTSLCAGFAVLLACIGLYGVVSYAASRRIREIGVRMALGADSRDVIRLFMRQTWTVTAIGLGIGFAAAVPFARMIDTEFLYGVTPNDFVSMFFAMVLIAVVAGIAGYLPARRAARTDPMEALRYE